MWNKTNSALALGEQYLFLFLQSNVLFNKQIKNIFLIISIAMIPKNTEKNIGKYKEEIIAT